MVLLNIILGLASKQILLKILLPPYTLHYPEAWQAMKLNSPVFPESGTLKCVNALNDPKLW